MPVDTLAEVQPITISKDQPNFVRTPFIDEIIGRSMLYLNTGFPVHFSAPAGAGKTVVAAYIAAQLEQPVILIHGDDEFSTSDLVGGEHGFRRKKTVDNFIHSVLKTDEKVQADWIDNRLTVACKHGFTLLYDEFTRSRAEANNVLLSVLEEKMLDLPAAREADAYLKVHPNFKAIFTSNPEEYAGVYKAQDALKDRMITIKLGHYDRETEILITCAKSGISKEKAEQIVDMVRMLRNEGSNGSTPSVRACIMIGKVLKLSDMKTDVNNKNFVKVCFDVLDSEITPRTKESDTKVRENISDAIKKCFYHKEG